MILEYNDLYYVVSRVFIIFVLFLIIYGVMIHVMKCGISTENKSNLL